MPDQHPSLSERVLAVLRDHDATVEELAQRAGTSQASVHSCLRYLEPGGNAVRAGLRSATNVRGEPVSGRRKQLWKLGPNV